MMGRTHQLMVAPDTVLRGCLRAHLLPRIDASSCVVHAQLLVILHCACQKNVHSFSLPSPACVLDKSAKTKNSTQNMDSPTLTKNLRDMGWA